MTAARVEGSGRRIFLFSVPFHYIAPLNIFSMTGWDVPLQPPPKKKKEERQNKREIERERGERQRERERKRERDREREREKN